jgi:hypothetical protein
MRIKEIDQEVYDFDWFAVDTGGYLVHFASGGGNLPNTVAASREDLEELHEYFLALPIISASVHINLNLAQTVKNIPDMHWYTESSIEYAQRGIFSFNKTDLTHPRTNNYYHLVAYPENALSLTELPATIATLVSRTILPFSVRGAFEIDADIIE